MVAAGHMYSDCSKSHVMVAAGHMYSVCPCWKHLQVQVTEHRSVSVSVIKFPMKNYCDRTGFSILKRDHSGDDHSISGTYDNGNNFSMAVPKYKQELRRCSLAHHELFLSIWCKFSVEFAVHLWYIFTSSLSPSNCKYKLTDIIATSLSL